MALVANTTIEAMVRQATRRLSFADIACAYLRKSMTSSGIDNDILKQAEMNTTLNASSDTTY
jgi:hypothetical protein